MAEINLSDEMIFTLMDAVQIAKDSISIVTPEWEKYDEAYDMLQELLVGGAYRLTTKEADEAIAGLQKQGRL